MATNTGHSRYIPWISDSGAQRQHRKGKRKERPWQRYNTTVEHEPIYREPVALDIEIQDEYDDESACALVERLRDATSIPDRKQPIKPSIRRHQMPFRFLDLLPELRNEVYFWSSLDHRPLRLKNFLSPSISRVSRQLRHECLPVFFKINTFVAEVRSTFMGFARESTGYNAKYADPRYLEYSRYGAVSLRKDVNPLLNSYWARLASFRRIDLVLLHPSDDVKDGRTIHRNAVLSMRNCVLSVHARPSTHRDRLQDYFHLRYILSLGASVGQHLTQKPGFKGFSFDNSKAIAATLRADPMDRPSSNAKYIEGYHYRPRSSLQPRTIPLSTYRRAYHTPSSRLLESRSRPTSVPLKRPLNLYKQLPLVAASPKTTKQDEDFDFDDAEGYSDSPSIRKFTNCLSDVSILPTRSRTLTKL